MGRALALIAALGVATSAAVSSPVRAWAQHDSAERTSTPPHSAPARIPPPQSAPPSAPAHTQIAGFIGFQAVSTLTYDDAPSTVHRLTATYMFPDRARWFIGVGDEKSPERQMRYRFHERVFSVEPRTARSTELEAEDRVATIRQLELRRALMLWPDGFEWKLVGEEARVEIAALGSFRARFEKTPSPVDLNASATAQRPVLVASLDEKGDEIDSFRALTWKEIRNRRWPAGGELWHAGKRVWREQLESIETSVRFLDGYFLPADRRENAPQAHAQSAHVQHLDLPRTVSLRASLKTGRSWEEALAEDARQRAAWEPKLRALGLELDSKTTIEISADAQPTACVLRLATVPETPPAEFTLVPARSANGIVVDAIGDVTAAQVSALARALPQDSKTLPAYVRIDRQEGKTSAVLIVLPLAESR